MSSFAPLFAALPPHQSFGGRRRFGGETNGRMIIGRWPMELSVVNWWVCGAVDGRWPMVHGYLRRNLDAACSKSLFRGCWCL